MKLNLFFVLFLISVSQFSFAQNKPEFKPEIKIGGVIYTGLQYNFDNSDFIAKVDTASFNPEQPFGYNPLKNQFETSKNSFYLERGYINIMAYLTPQINVRITPDLFSFTDGNGKTQYAYQLKFANVNYTPFIDENGMSLSFNLGLISNMWVSSMDKYFGYRGVVKTITDYPYTYNTSRTGININRTTGTYFPTADLGLTTKITFPYKYADLYFSVFQGNGFRNLSFDNRFKDVMFTGFIYPLAGIISSKTEKYKKLGITRIDGIVDLTLGGYAYLGRLDRNEFGEKLGNQYMRNRFGGMFSMKYNFKNYGYIKLGGEIDFQANQDTSSTNPDLKINAMGLSVFTDFALPIEFFKERVNLMARYDNFNPNTGNSGIIPYTFGVSPKQQLLIIGLFYKPSNVLTFGISYHGVFYENNYAVKYDGSSARSINRLFFNTTLDF